MVSPESLKPSKQDYDKRTALHLACCQGHVELVDFLLDVSAEVNCCDRMGFSPLVSDVSLQ
jgi:ankyrin repeat protein